MTLCIEKLRFWFERHPKLRQWAWFAGLWCAGLLAVTCIAYPLKYLAKLAFSY